MGSILLFLWVLIYQGLFRVFVFAFPEPVSSLDWSCQSRCQEMQKKLQEMMQQTKDGERATPASG